MSNTGLVDELREKLDHPCRADVRVVREIVEQIYRKEQTPKAVMRGAAKCQPDNLNEAGSQAKLLLPG